MCSQTGFVDLVQLKKAFLMLGSSSPDLLDGLVFALALFLNLLRTSNIAKYWATNAVFHFLC
jgi:hypothetical protein